MSSLKFFCHSLLAVLWVTSVSCALSQQLQKIETERLEIAVTAAEYCVFLNAVASSDSTGLYDERVDFMVRLGTPGQYTYAVALGAEEKPMTYISESEVTRYCDWSDAGCIPVGYSEQDPGIKSNRSHCSIVSAEKKVNQANAFDMKTTWDALTTTEKTLLVLSACAVTLRTGAGIYECINEGGADGVALTPQQIANGEGANSAGDLLRQQQIPENLIVTEDGRTITGAEYDREQQEKTCLRSIGNFWMQTFHPNTVAELKKLRLEHAAHLGQINDSTQTIEEREGTIAEKEEELRNLQIQLAERQGIIAQKDELTLQLQQQVAERQEAIGRLEQADEARAEQAREKLGRKRALAEEGKQARDVRVVRFRQRCEKLQPALQLFGQHCLLERRVEEVAAQSEKALFEVKKLATFEDRAASVEQHITHSAHQKETETAVQNLQEKFTQVQTVTGKIWTTLLDVAKAKGVIRTLEQTIHDPLSSQTLIAAIQQRLSQGFTKLEEALESAIQEREGLVVAARRIHEEDQSKKKQHLEQAQQAVETTSAALIKVQAEKDKATIPLLKQSAVNHASQSAEQAKNVLERETTEAESIMKVAHGTEAVCAKGQAIIEQAAQEFHEASELLHVVEENARLVESLTQVMEVDTGLFSSKSYALVQRFASMVHDAKAHQEKALESLKKASKDACDLADVRDASDAKMPRASLEEDEQTMKEEGKLLKKALQNIQVQTSQLETAREAAELMLLPDDETAAEEVQRVREKFYKIMEQLENPAALNNASAATAW